MYNMGEPYSSSVELLSFHTVSKARIKNMDVQPPPKLHYYVRRSPEGGKTNSTVNMGILC